MTNRWRHSLWLRIYPVKISSKDEPTWRCQQNPFIRALGIQSCLFSELLFLLMNCCLMVYISCHRSNFIQEQISASILDNLLVLNNNGFYILESHACCLNFYSLADTGVCFLFIIISRRVNHKGNYYSKYNSYTRENNNEMKPQLMMSAVRL